MVDLPENLTLSVVDWLIAQEEVHRRAQLEHLKAIAGDDQSTAAATHVLQLIEVKLATLQTRRSELKASRRSV